jgi:hypothetical protein
MVSDEEYQNEHAAMLGRVTLAWNDCHSTVFTIFHDLSGMTCAHREVTRLA